MSSPTARLAGGVVLTLVIILAYAGYTLNSVRRMRQVQTDIVDTNRKSALQLIRIQGDLNALALALRDMLDRTESYPLSAWASQLDRIRENLDDALRAESRIATARRDPQQNAYLQASFQQLWSAVAQMKALAAQGQSEETISFIRETLEPQQQALTSFTARLLVQNNAEEQRAATQVAAIYSEIERNAYLFLAISLALVLVVSLGLIRSNRLLFDRLASLSNQRRELAQQLISSQESTLRTISRDLHDEFGQILTALGAMLTRAARHAPDSFTAELQESRAIVQDTLEKVRALSQTLQPVILEEQGLGPAIEWHISVFQRQTGIAVEYHPPATPPVMEHTRSIHVFRILQEALNNAARHANVETVTVRLINEPFTLQVADNGGGIDASATPGVGLAGMRERAELLGGALSVVSPPGTTITLQVPYV
ncbi:MAG: MCP four helix bundle domain-containing protein [Bryobacterales bacterium]|nr:MCP four helix bundle domain-containing protein [Bryobacterales bacterium]